MSDSQPASAYRAVFLSYASQDAETAKKLCDALRAVGVEVWFDQNELVGGDAWDAKIRKQISECGLFVPVISAATQARGEGYFRLEWKLSVDRSHLMAHDQPFLLPVVIDATKDSEARVPLEFRAVQWTRLPAGETNTAFCARVKKLLSVPGATTESATSTPTPRNAPVPPAAASKSSRSWLVAVAPGAAALVVLALWQPWKKSAPASAAISTTTTAVANLPPSDARKLTLKARALIDDDLMAARENFRLAEELCQRAVTLAPDDGEAWATLARISCEVMTRNYETNARRRELARSQSERAAHLAPDSIETGLATAAYLDFTGELSAAETTLRQLLARAATDERVALAYVRALGRLNRLSDAENFRRTHPAFAGNSARVLAAQAYSLRTPGNFARASELVERAQAIAPSRVGYFTKLLLLVIDHADLEAAKSFAEKLPPQLAQEDIFAALVARVWLRSGNPTMALNLLNRIPQDFFEESRRVEPKGYLTGRALEQSGKPVAAEAEWRAALAVVERRLAAEPNRVPYLRFKALLQALTKQSDEAERTWRLFTELADRKRPVDALEANLTRVEILLAANRVDDAIAELVAEKSWGDQPDPSPVTSLHFDPWFESIRKDARVQAIIASGEASRREQLGEATKGASEAAPVPDMKSVAVLAFADLSAARDSEYFSDGISEELLNVLAKVPGLTVKARTSSFYFKGKQVPLPEIAKQLGVAYVVEGSVRKSGPQVRITARLSRADTAEQIWSENFNRELKDIFAVQDEIAGLIANNLSLKLGANSRAAPAVVNPQAFELYLQGRQAWNRRTREGYDQADALFARAIALDPSFARAYVGQADVMDLRAFDEGSIGRWDQRNSDYFRKMHAVLDRALALDPDSAEAYASLENAFYDEWNFPAAERAARRAVELNPNYATGWHWLGILCWDRGDLDEALVDLRRAADLDPFSLAIVTQLSLCLRDAGRTVEALAYAERSVSLQPDAPRVLSAQALALLDLGRTADALPLARKLLQSESGRRWWQTGMVVTRAGMKAEAAELLSQYQGLGDQRLAAPILALLGRREEFLAVWQSRPMSTSQPWFLWEPELDPVRSDPRFLAVLEKTGLTEAHARAQAWRKAHPTEVGGQKMDDGGRKK